MEEMISMHELYETFTRTKTIPDDWAKHRRTCAMHTVLGAANARLEAARKTQTDSDFERVLTYLAENSETFAQHELPMQCRVDHLRAHTLLGQCKLEDAEKVFATIIDAVCDLEKTSPSAMKELLAKDEEVEQIRLDAYINRAMLKWYKHGAADGHDGMEMPQDFLDDFKAIQQSCVNDTALLPCCCYSPAVMNNLSFLFSLT